METAEEEQPSKKEWEIERSWKREACELDPSEVRQDKILKRQAERVREPRQEVRKIAS